MVIKANHRRLIDCVISPLVLLLPAYLSINVMTCCGACHLWRNEATLDLPACSEVDAKLLLCSKNNNTDDAAGSEREVLQILLPERQFAE